MTIRQTIASNLLENTPESIRKVRKLIQNDSWAHIIYVDEKDKVRIEQYLDGLMPERLMRSFEKLVKNDEQLLRKFDERKKIHQNIYHIVPLLGALEKAHQTFERKYRNKEFVLKPVLKKERKIQTAIRLAVAASVIFLLGLGIFYKLASERQFTNDEIFAAYYKPFLPAKGKTYNARMEGVLQAKEKYLQKDYTSSYTIFLHLPDNINISLEKNFFLGLNLIEMGDYNSAIHHFESTHVEGVGFLPEVNWYLGLCYTKTGQDEKAIEALTRLIHTSEYKKTEARKLLLVLK